MLAIEKDVYKRAKSGEMTIRALADYLIRTFPVTEIALALAETIQYEDPKPITITKEEFDAHFKIRGLKADGTIETRGRKKDYMP